MGVHIEDNKLVVVTEPKSFHFDLLKDVDINLRHEVYFIIKQNELLAESAIKIEIRQLMFRCKHGNCIHEHGKRLNEWTTQICL